jgi:6-phosphogluconolactonase (cycloisomerase 2 family)
VFAGNSLALRLQRPEGAADYRAPISVRDNFFWGSEEAVVVRVDPGQQFRFLSNRGKGRLQGWTVSPADWQTSRVERPPFPAFEGHRAWDHLDRASVEARFRIPPR